ncbi:MAG: phosphoadenylyl-sulfate reductase [Candidatus Promineifilaceae bacterium]|nr:phosphoadenylyl-sulfate reductase [Candidatus Promineifilaceae bacterium]
MQINLQIASDNNQNQLTWFPANLSGLNRRFDCRPATDLLRWGLVTFGDEIVLATGFGPSGIVLMHMASQIRPRPKVFYLQTDLFFPETITLRDELAEHLDIEFIEVHSGLSLIDQAQQFGPELWRHNPDLCCHMRKVEPLRRFLAGKKAWISGIRRDQSPTRAHTPLVAWDSANHLLKLNPLAAWSKEWVWDYLQKYKLPYNKLHNEGYTSIGCRPCTRAVVPGETERAGRWSGLNKTECGIHIQADGQVVRRLIQAPNGSS